MKALATLLFLLILIVPTRAQIGMGSGTPHPSAALDVQATDKALYPPRMTTAQRKAIVNPQPGAFVYDLEKGTFYLYDGANWSSMAFNSATNPPPIDRTASDGASGDFFGGSVAISGDYAVVGSYSDDVGANSNQGSAYIFVRSGGTWTQQAKITAADGATDDNFGSSVAISGDYVLVGKSSSDLLSVTIAQGAAYVFVRSGTSWVQQAKLTAADGANADRFGHSVAISGDYALVGRHKDNIGAKMEQGSAYVFVRSGGSWTQQFKITASDGAAYDLFGSSVALSGTSALVGSPSSNYNDNIDQGVAYVFLRSGTTWDLQKKLTADDGAAYDNFGCSVSLSDDYAIVGSESDDITYVNQGSAYIFSRSVRFWFQRAKLIDVNNGRANDKFGSSVAISGDYALVGNPNSTGNTNGSTLIQGAAYLYKVTGTTWSLVRKITDNLPTESRNGTSIGISNGTYIVGGPRFQSNQGKVGFGVVDN